MHYFHPYTPEPAAFFPPYGFVPYEAYQAHDQYYAEDGTYGYDGGGGYYPEAHPPEEVECAVIDCFNKCFKVAHNLPSCPEHKKTLSKIREIYKKCNKASLEYWNRADTETSPEAQLKLFIISKKHKLCEIEGRMSLTSLLKPENRDSGHDHYNSIVQLHLRIITQKITERTVPPLVPGLPPPTPSLPSSSSSSSSPASASASSSSTSDSSSSSTERPARRPNHRNYAKFCDPRLAEDLPTEQILKILTEKLNELKTKLHLKRAESIAKKETGNNYEIPELLNKIISIRNRMTTLSTPAAPVREAARATSATPLPSLTAPPAFSLFPSFPPAPPSQFPSTSSFSSSSSSLSKPSEQAKELEKPPGSTDYNKIKTEAPKKTPYDRT